MTVTTVLLNEIKINPPGNADTPWEYAEIACPKNSSLAGYYFVAFEGDGDSSSGSPGVADIVVDLGTANCGSNGLAIVKAAAGGHAVAAPTTVFTSATLDTGSGMENTTTSFAIVKSPTAPIVQGTDYDTANNGTLTLPAGASIVDGVAVFDQTNGVTDQTYVPRLSKAGITPDAVSRIPGANTPLSDAAWYFGDLSGASGDGVTFDPAKSSANLPANAVLTPGAPNMAAVAPAPGPGTGEGEQDPKDPGTGEEDPGGDQIPSGDSTGTSSGGSRTRPTGAVPAPKTPSTASCAVASAPSSSSSAGLLGLVVALTAFVTRRKRSR